MKIVDGIVPVSRVVCSVGGPDEERDELGLPPLGGGGVPRLSEQAPIQPETQPCGGEAVRPKQRRHPEMGGLGGDHRYR